HIHGLSMVRKRTNKRGRHKGHMYFLEFSRRKKQVTRGFADQRKTDRMKFPRRREKLRKPSIIPQMSILTRIHLVFEMTLAETIRSTLMKAFTNSNQWRNEYYEGDKMDFSSKAIDFIADRVVMGSPKESNPSVISALLHICLKLTSAIYWYRREGNYITGMDAMQTILLDMGYLTSKQKESAIMLLTEIEQGMGMSGQMNAEEYDKYTHRAMRICLNMIHEQVTTNGMTVLLSDLEMEETLKYMYMNAEQAFSLVINDELAFSYLFNCLTDKNPLRG
ncbi:hypothetical protein PENTCL1PPCAC_22250, partial [Pristionchus entomophagus]